VAAVLSLFIPGAGQMYKGQLGRGLCCLFLAVCAYASTLYSVVCGVVAVILHILVIADAFSGHPYAQAAVQQGLRQPPAGKPGRRQDHPALEEKGRAANSTPQAPLAAPMVQKPKSANTETRVGIILAIVFVVCFVVLATGLCLFSRALNQPSLTPETSVGPTLDAPETSRPTETRDMAVSQWQGVHIGMPSDDVLRIHPKEETTAAAEVIGKDSDGLLVRHSYPGAYLILARRWGTCPQGVDEAECYCYRVIEIRLR
jgi:TM2 domain-containing membrane protein YozV